MMHKYRRSLILRSAFLLFSSLILLSSCGPSHKETDESGPFVGGGGGEVTVCFASPEIREASFSTEGTLLAEARSQILQIYSFDVLENRGQFYTNAFPEETETSVEFLNRHLEYLFSVSPYFALKLNEAVVLILDHKDGTSSWKDMGALKPLGDQGERGLFSDGYELKRVGLYCRPAQIVKRIETYDKGTDHKPRVEIEFDRDLFERLNWQNNLPFPGVHHSKNAGAFHQAVLILHEALYLMTSSLGAKDSESARDLLSTVIFDSKKFEELMQKKETEDSMALKRRWHRKLIGSVTGFGLKDFAEVFLPKLSIREQESLHGREALKYSYAQVRNFVNQWLATQQKDHALGFAVAAVTRDYFSEGEAEFLSTKMTERDAFVYASEVIWYTEPKEYIHYEFLFILPDDDLTLTKRYYCARIDQYLRNFSDRTSVQKLKAVFEKGQRYCGFAD